MTATATPPMLESDVLKAAFMGAFDRLDRLPTLRAALERTASLCTDNMRDMCDPPPELTLKHLETGAASDMLAQHEDESVAAGITVAQWNTRALMSADRACVSAIVEMMLGGDGKAQPVQLDRPYSSIDIGIARQFFTHIAAALEAAFAPIAKSTFVVEAATDRLDFDVVGRRHSAVVVAGFTLRVWEREGEVLLVAPKNAIDAMRQVLAQPVSDEAQKEDPRWSDQIRDEITRTSVTLSGVLDERLAPLHELAELKVGQIVPLSATAASRIRVECGGEPLLWCQLGKSNGVYTLRVEEPIDRDQEFMNDILAG